ncbi:dihydrofolate reductase family protein [Kribbella catacumbae]|uniref:dihydrofolate reductase family protein n=1 Tax=Kribbella catacumbae TaxID=460086 RepID=UPI00037BAB5A|nr:dihydrofolate reductase family protein [Kribbella catacumbae]
MRDLVVTENITVDGVIDASGGWFNPGDAGEVDLSDVLAALEVQRESADAFLVGRQTFEDMRGYWPLQTDDQTGISEYLNAVSKYVVSTTLQDPQWENCTVLRGLDDVEALKAQPGKDIVTTGSIKLVHSLAAAGLVDEYRLFVYPVVLGKGQRLFPDTTTPSTLHLTETQPFHSGITLLRYRTH